MGTEFRKKVYEVVKKIPRGKILTYQEVAYLAGSPHAYRAVGTALHKNRDPKIPCHRVIRSDGNVGGFNRGKATKLGLLKREGADVSSFKIS